MKAAPSRTKTRKLLAFATISLAAIFAFGTPTAHADDSAYPQGYPKLGVRTESVPGHNLECSDAGYRNVLTMLFLVHTSSSKGGNIKAYCTELEVNIQFEPDLKASGWKEFPGTNKFKDNPDVQTKVAWIAQCNYPQTNLAEVTKASSIQDLTEEDTIIVT